MGIACTVFFAANFNGYMMETDDGIYEEMKYGIIE
jgi:hypothetical protein